MAREATVETRAEGLPDLERKVAFLRRTDSYPHRPAEVQAVETHMAWVFLAGEEAYKLKKPVRYDFLDFSTLDARRRDCVQEIRLNRRLAASVYRGLASVRLAAEGALTLDGPGRVVEWLVHMRRLPRDRMLDVRIREGRVSTEEIRKVVKRLGRFYAEAPRIGITGREYRDRFRRDVRQCRRELIDAEGRIPEDVTNRVSDALLAFLAEEAPLFSARVDAKRIVDGHGDLRPEHICLEDEPVVIDCLEFNEDFRVVDPVDEVAFLAMECARLGAPDVGESFGEEFARVARDEPPVPLVAFYRSFRALLRAKIAIWHTLDDAIRDHETWVDRARTYLELAAAALPVR